MILLVFFFSKQKFSRQKILEKRAKKMISHSIIFFIAKKLATTTSENKTNSFHQANPIGLYEIQQQSLFAIFHANSNIQYLISFQQYYEHYYNILFEYEDLSQLSIILFEVTKQSKAWSRMILIIFNEKE